MGASVEATPEGAIERKKSESQIEDGYEPDHHAKGAEYDMTAAIEAENEEHNMGVWEAVKAYPMASLWAFIMSCTIVSCALTPVRD